MTDSGNPAESQESSGRKRTLSTIAPGLEILGPLSGDEIAWHLILIGVDCGMPGPEIARWLMKLSGYPFWPDVETLAVLLQDAGL